MKSCDTFFHDLLKVESGLWRQGLWPALSRAATWLAMGYAGASHLWRAASFASCCAASPRLNFRSHLHTQPAAMAVPLLALVCWPATMRAHAFSIATQNRALKWASQTGLGRDTCPARHGTWLGARHIMPPGKHSSHAAIEGKQRASTAAIEASTLEIDLVPCLAGTSNNYVFLLHDAAAGVTAVVDTSEVGPIEAALAARGATLTHILNTHHHRDHTGGNAELKKKYNATIVGPKADKDRIPLIDVALGEGDTWQFGSHTMHVFDTPGHTKGHVSFYFPSASALFPGDTLFSLGCGRLFEGTPAQMWASLSKLAALPPGTRVFCGHEYTQANAKFALSVEPGNRALVKRAEEVQRLRRQDLPTIPSTLGEELAANPFLRPHSEEIRRSLNVPMDASEVEAFAAIRRAKDRF